MACLVQPIASGTNAWIAKKSSISIRCPVSERIGTAAASVFRVKVAHLRGETRGAASVARARQAAMYLAHVEFGLTFTEVGQAFGRTRTTVARACRQIEDLRADRNLDAKLGRLERMLRSERGAPLGAA